MSLNTLNKPKEESMNEKGGPWEKRVREDGQSYSDKPGPGQKGSKLRSFADSQGRFYYD